MPDCYFCGEVERVHEHHIIPRRFGPIRNQTAMVCPDCHVKIEELYHILLGYVADNPEVLEEDLDEGMTSRQREVSEAIGEPVYVALPTLYDEKNGNMSAILRDINREMGEGEELSRPTLYEWASELGLLD